MNYEERFGKLVLSGEGKQRGILMKILMLIPAVCVIALAFVLLGDGPNDIIYQGFAIVIAALAIFGILFAKKYKEISVYENGIVLARGSKVIELGYEDVKGVQDSTTVIKAYGVITASKNRFLTIVRKDGTKIALNKAMVTDFDQFADEICAAVTKYLLRGITRENINQARIVFDDKLVLADGHFVFDAGGSKGKISIPVDSVSGAEIRGDGYWLNLLGSYDEKGMPEELASIRADKALNLEALSQILGMLLS